MGITTKKIIAHTMIKNAANADSFIEFIKKLIKELDDKKQHYLLLDNASIHRSIKFKELIKKYPNVNIIYNVPYSPQYNPIEMVFSFIKNIIRHKNDNTNITNLKKNIKIAINKMTSTKLNNYFKHSLHF